VDGIIKRHMNLNLIFRDVNESPLTGKKVLFTPQAPPNTTASFLSVGDSFNFPIGAGGVVTASIVPATYKVEIGTPTPATSFYLVATETGSYIYSGSARNGAAQCLFFDLLYMVKSPFATKKLQLTPQWNYPIDFSGSIIALCATSSLTDSTGSVYFNSLVPGPYLVEAFGKIDTSWYISVPGWENTGSDAPCWNARDLRIIKPSKGIPVKINNLDNSYVLTISSSDARYFHVGGTVDTASYAYNAVSASYAGTASVALNFAPQPSASHADTASVSFNSVSASYAQTASVALKVDTASYAFTISQSQVGPITITDPTNVATLQLVGDIGTGGHLSTIEGSPSGLNFNVQSGDFIGIGGDLHIGDHNIVPNDGKFLGTASYADQTQDAVSASWANEALTSSHALQAVSADFADLAQNAVSASWAPSSPSVSASFADRATSASFATSASNAKSSSFARSALTANTAFNLDLIDVTSINSPYQLLMWDNTPIYGNDQNLVYNPFTRTLQVTSSNAISASWAPSVSVTTVPSASWASQSLSASWAPSLPNSLTASYLNLGSLTINNIPNVIGNLFDSGSISSYNGYNIFTQSAIPGVWLITTIIDKSGNITAPTITSALQGTASWAVSASWAPNAISNPLTLGDGAISGEVRLVDAANSPVYYSIEAGNSELVLTAPLTYIDGDLLVNGNIIGRVTSSLFGTASWAKNSISASWAPSTSVSSVSASWASQSLSSSFSQTASFSLNAGTTLFTGSIYYVTASNAISASWASQSFTAVSSSWAPVGSSTIDIINIQVFS
jgi:hypothetical protein